MNSDIYGTGFGSTHNWVGYTPQNNSKQTLYTCSACMARFIHAYDNTPNIFDAIELSGVADVCPNLKEVKP